MSAQIVSAPMGGARAILVVGMHRSGTSLLARILNLHGAALGSELLRADKGNPKGYWENLHVVMFHEKVLRALGMAWDSPGALPDGWELGSQFDIFVDELCELICREFAGERLWAVKDPRLCRLLPIWKEALARLSVKPRFIFAVRHPEEVISSLMRRDELGPALASLLWLNHLDEPVAATDGFTRAMVVYEDLLADWRSSLGRLANQLDLAWPVPSADCASAVDEHLDISLHHHRENDACRVPLAWRDDFARVFLACRAVSESGGDWNRLRDELGRANAATGVVALLAGDLPTPSKLTEQKRAAAAAQAKCAKLVAELEQSTEALDRLGEQTASAIAEATGLRELVLAQGAQLVAMAGSVQSQGHQILELTSAAAVRQQELATLRADHAIQENAQQERVRELEAAVAGLHREQAALKADGVLSNERAERLASELLHAKGQLADILRSHSWRLTRPLRLSMRLLRGDTDYLRDALRQWRSQHASPSVPWGGLPSRPLESGADVSSHADAAVEDSGSLRDSLLVVDHSVPEPDRDAGSRSMWHFIRMFRRRGLEVKFWSHNPQPDPRYADLLRQEGVEVISTYPGGFNAWLRAHGAGLRWALLSRPHVALEYLSALRAQSDARVLYYGHDIHHARLKAQWEHQPSPQLEQDIATHMAWEHAIWPAADAVYYPAEGESRQVRDWLSRHGHDASAVRTIPVFAFDSFPEVQQPGIAQRSGMVFVGGFAHAPNADAAEWFVKQVMPLILEQEPDAHLHLLGSHPTPAVLGLASPHVSVAGYVSDADLLGYYQRARVSVAPLRFGAGMKGKVIEAMRHGVPCATTPVGAQGLEDVPFLVVAEQPLQFAENVLKLLRDDEYWRSVSLAQQQLVRERFSEEALWRIVQPDIESGFQLPRRKQP